MWTAVLALCLSLPQEPLDLARVDDERALQAWSKLLDGEREDVLARYEAELESFDTFQRRLIQYARGLEERDPGLMPADPGPSFFDPTVHAPAQPIARQWIEADSARGKSEHKRIFGKLPAARWIRGWRYDWGTREVYRLPAAGSLDSRLTQALAGVPPGLDLAQALIERALDDGSQQKVLGAFGHAYTDRTGNAFAGITLYDAWSSGAELEMPDVDVLGIVHDVLGDWDSWKAPVPDHQHDKLYGKVGTLFHDAQRHRGLRTAIAWVFCEGDPELLPPYSTCLSRFHALWEAHSSEPAAVAAALPKPEGWGEFLAEWSNRDTGNLEARSRARRTTLAEDRQRVRGFFLSILAETGAFERKQRPTPPAPRDK